MTKEERLQYIKERFSKKKDEFNSPKTNSTIINSNIEIQDESQYLDGYKEYVKYYRSNELTSDAN